MVASDEDVALSLRAMSDIRRLQYQDRASQKGLTLSKYLSQKLDGKTIADARARLNQLGSSAKPLQGSVKQGNWRPDRAVIVIPDDDDETKPPPAKKRRVRGEVIDENVLFQRMQAARPMSIIPESLHRPHVMNTTPHGGNTGHLLPQSFNLAPVTDNIIYGASAAHNFSQRCAPWFASKPTNLDYFAPSSSQPSAPSYSVPQAPHPLSQDSQGFKGHPISSSMPGGLMALPLPFNTVLPPAQHPSHVNAFAPLTNQTLSASSHVTKPTDNPCTCRPAISRNGRTVVCDDCQKTQARTNPAAVEVDSPQPTEQKRATPAAASDRGSSYTEGEPQLSAEQKKVVDSISAGTNVFYTGSAGTGKSTVLKAFVSNLKAQGKQVDIVAPSGIAALAVGGTTIFSYAGWTPDSFKKPMHELLKSAHGKNVRKRLCRTDCLVIDEISMVERDMLVRLDKLMREARNGYYPSREDPPSRSLHTAMSPFGGAQIVITGDFCQLPPVRPFKFCVHCGGDELEGWSRQDGRLLRCRKCKLEHRDQDKWAFASETWNACEFTYIELSKIHRQNDKKFINILQTCRKSIPLSSFQQNVLLAPKPDPEGAVKLMPTRAEVDRENSLRFRQLPGNMLSFDCRDLFDWRNQNEPELQWKGTPKYLNRPSGPLKALNDHRFEEHIDLKKDMLVILLVNLDFTAGLVNGSQGRIVGFEQYDPSKILVSAKPLSSTGNRDSSMSPRRKSGRGRYSGSSRSKSIYGGGQGPDQQLGELAALKNDEVHKFMQSQPIKEWPMVEFTNGVKRTIYAHCQLNELGTEQPYSLLGRTQIPLLASWAITCHKSQGMTLNRVVVDLHNSFERGMVYVALSRATNLEGLKVVRLPKIMDIPGNVEVQTWLEEKFGKKRLGQ